MSAALSSLLLMLTPIARAADIANGQTLYAIHCASCHGPDPRQNINGIRAGADNPNLIQTNINNNVGGMGILRNVLSSTQIADIAAYIGSVVNPNQGTAKLATNAKLMIFSQQQVNSSSAGQTLTLTNSGSGTLVFSNTSISSADFTLLSGCGSNLAAGASCFMTVTFRPRTAGDLTGIITIQSNVSTALIGLIGIAYNAGSPPAAAPAGAAIEYYHAGLDHFFITADGPEQQIVDSGGAGQWLRTGHWFKVGGSNDVCRFYGNTAINPATGILFGPNSHFYTGDNGECNSLQAAFNPNAKSWLFEGRVFTISPPSNGTCPTGMTVIKRAYNRGFELGIDSNHYIGRNSSMIALLVSLGWVDEGAVMCASP